MRHRVGGRKLGRTTAHRTAMLANMAASLIKHGRIETTVAKAKTLRSVADRMVTLGKRGTVAARRRAISIIRDKGAVGIAFDELAERFQSRQGGYTRIMKLGYRHGDSAPMAMIEYLPAKGQKGAESERAKPKDAAKEKAKAPKAERKATKPAAKKAGAKAKKAPAKKRAGARKAASAKGKKKKKKAK